MEIICVSQMKEKREKSHEEMQKAQSRRQLEQAKQANIEKLVSSATVNTVLYSSQNFHLLTCNTHVISMYF